MDGWRRDDQRTKEKKRKKKKENRHSILSDRFTTRGIKEGDARGNHKEETEKRS